MMIVQCRMARTALGWSLDDLASQSGVARRTVARFEAGEGVTFETIERLRATLSQAGILFVEVEGRPAVAAKP
jgi:transcriptional regulator with XRE-family HTH domain